MWDFSGKITAIDWIFLAILAGAAWATLDVLGVVLVGAAMAFGSAGPLLVAFGLLFLFSV